MHGIRDCPGKQNKKHNLGTVRLLQPQKYKVLCCIKITMHTPVFFQRRFQVRLT